MFEPGGFGGDFDAGLFCGFEVGRHVGEAGGLIHPGGTLKMIDEGAEVEVYGATDAVIVVAEHIFGMDEAGLIFVDFDATFD